MGRVDPIFAGPRRAAAMLDLTPREFLRLVDKGALPRPVSIGGEHPRWNMRQIESILTGEAMADEFEP